MTELCSVQSLKPLIILILLSAALVQLLQQQRTAHRSSSRRDLLLLKTTLNRHSEIIVCSRSSGKLLARGTHFFIWFATFLLGAQVMAQQTNNSSSLTNSAAPSASSVTTGGTNINYQTNNTYQNEFGFAPGVFCRTPTLYIGGSWGEGFLNAYDPVQSSGNNNLNYSFNAGIAVPFGSQILDYCKQLAFAIAQDREISSQLSMLRTCDQLKKEGIEVDPDKYPLLKPCAKDNKGPQSATVQQQSNSNPQTNKSEPVLKPKTTRVL
jgi:hypothetical protein